MKINIKLNTDYLFALFVLLITSLAIAGAIVYRLYALNNAGVIISLIIVMAFLYFILRSYLKNKERIFPKSGGKCLKPGKMEYLLIAGYLVLSAAGFFILYQSQTALAIVSPWQAVPGFFFPVYATASLWLLFSAKRLGPSILPLVSLHYFLSFSVALIVYRLGYGFDPFIHRATENLISSSGAVDPKPFYYLGQYGLTVILHKITYLPITWLDKTMAPFFSALLLPYYLYRLMANWFADKNATLILVIAILILPFAVFIVTTPQNLAYLFLLLAVIIGLSCRNTFELLLIYSLSLAALVTQPIAGLPALLFAFGLTAYHRDNKKYKIVIFSLLFAGAVVFLPLAFYLVGQEQIAVPGQTDGENAMAQAKPLFAIPDQENIFLNTVYLIGFNHKNIFILLVLTGILIAYRFREKCRTIFLYAGISLALILSYYLTKLLPFDFLISYERSDYPNRLLLTAGLFALPFVILSLYRFIYKLHQYGQTVRIIFYLFFALLMSCSLYLSYPRFDRYFNSHIYAVSQSDINAVRWINGDAQGGYIVLANQQVSAAALSQFGFHKYYKSEILNHKSEIFYYPIPTGGPLYQYYLDMVYENAGRATMLKAMDLVGVDTGYFVLNKYWWAFPKILAEARLSADSFREIDNGSVYVFKYAK